jgi:eukaryotic-like serine/threonine-protein kinase
MIRRSSRIAALAVSLLGAGVRARSAQDSPMFRVDAEHSGFFGGASIVKEPQVQWRFQTGGKVFSTPSVASGSVYIGSNDGYLYSLDATSGKQRWRFQTGARITSSPAVFDGKVYFVSYDGFAYALDATTGAVAWKFKSGGERRFAGRHLHGGQPEGETMPDQWDFFLSSPTVAGGKVVFGSGDGNVYALDARTGTLKWRFKTGDVVHASPAISNGVVFVGSWDGYFYAIDVESGKQKWRLETGHDSVTHNQEGFQSSATVVNGVVYVGCRDAHVYAIDAATGAVRWKYSTKGAWVSASPTVRDRKVFVGTGDSSLLIILDAATGRLLAQTEKVWMIFGSPAVTRDMVYVGSMDGKLSGLDHSGRIIWNFQTDASRRNLSKYVDAKGAMNYSSIVAERFYDDSALRFEKIFSMGSFLSSPVLVNGVLYIGSTDGSIYALK